ncbi:hypothetical protein LTR47_003813 [Exophiala xenobiotica]|nr:hypothetical protein LTR47_003813 [Exophiala xenobiotica]KAK5251980.1 hypothetical protein LTS06_003492 [Exophiala xenobiotica]KAK5372091.1 hypothetical protein LTR11_006212 [Exophiala xenobiotica]KAK5375319.1 hypothetical protein LTS03_005874 [Exophiala xenobiotica]
MAPLLLAALVAISTLAAYTCYFLLRLFVLVLLVVIGECMPLRAVLMLFRFPRDPHGALLLPKPPEVDWARFTAWFTDQWRRGRPEQPPTPLRDPKQAMKDRRRRKNSAWSTTTKTASAWIWNKAHATWSATTEPVFQWYAAVLDNRAARKRKEDQIADARAFAGRKLWPFIQEASDEQATHHSCPVCCEHRLVTNEAPVPIQVESAELREKEKEKEKKKWKKQNRKKAHRHERKPFRAAGSRRIVKWLSQVED